MRIPHWNQKLMSEQVVMCLGVGGLGSTVAIALCRLGVKKMWVCFCCEGQQFVFLIHIVHHCTTFLPITHCTTFNRLPLYHPFSPITHCIICLQPHNVFHCTTLYQLPIAPHLHNLFPQIHHCTTCTQPFTHCTTCTQPFFSITHCTTLYTSLLLLNYPMCTTTTTAHRTTPHAQLLAGLR